MVLPSWWNNYVMFDQQQSLHFGANGEDGLGIWSGWARRVHIGVGIVRTDSTFASYLLLQLIESLFKSSLGIMPTIGA